MPKKYDVLSASQKLNNEIEFSKKIKITPYPETQKALENNVKIDDEDNSALTRIKRKSNAT